MSKYYNYVDRCGQEHYIKAEVTSEEVSKLSADEVEELLQARANANWKKYNGWD